MNLSVVGGIFVSLIELQCCTSRIVRFLKIHLSGRHVFMDVGWRLISRVCLQEVNRKADFLSVDKKMWSLPSGFMNRGTICHSNMW